MRYRMIDVELREPLPATTLSADESGLGVVIRSDDRPVHFLLAERAPGAVVGPDELGRLISESGAVGLLTERIRRELLGDDVPRAAVDLTVAICTHGRPELLLRCVESLRRLRERKDDFEILVVDNAPADTATRDAVADLPGVHYVVEPKVGLDFARNRAIANAAGTYLAYMDDDVEADRGWLAGLQEAVADNPDAGALTGLVLPFELDDEAQILFERRGGFGRGFERIRYGQRMPSNPLYPCGAGVFGAGCNMVYRRAVLERLGGFDEALDTGAPLPGGGDLDMFYRVVRAGHPLVYEPRMLVFHKHRKSYRALRHQYWTWGTGFMAFVVKSYRADPSQRSKFRRLVRWWVFDQLRMLRRSLRSGGALTPGLVLAELSGGVVGLAGTYDRSVARSARIRREAA